MLMLLISTLVALLLGTLATANLIVAKKPDAKTLVDKIMPFAGIIGIVGLVLGLIGLLNALYYFAPVAILFSFCLSCLGLIFGLGVIEQGGKIPALANLVTKLDPWKGAMGIVVLVVTVVYLINWLLI